MSTRSQVVGAPPGGAGRTLHLMWPDFNFIGGALTTNGWNRVGAVATANVSANVTQGAPPATTLQTYKGLRCWGLSSAVGGAGTAIWFAAVLNPSRDATKFPIGVNDRAVIELRWLLAFDRPAGDLGDSLDLGLGISPGNNNQNTFNPAVGAVYRAGAQFGPGGPGKLRLRSRAGQTVVGPPPYATGLGFDTGNVAVAGFDEREWHLYQLRIIGGTNAGNGTVKALIDGVQFSTFDASVAANIFPDVAAGVGGVVGVRLGVCNNTNATFDKMYLGPGSLIVAGAETDL